MSVFRVKLQTTQQGTLDRDPSTAIAAAITGQGLGTPFAISKQRQVYVMGPNRTNRLLVDGETFTDCNYWKRFTYPTLPLDSAFIEVVTDDGSYYSDVPGDNTVPVVLNKTITAGTTYTDTGNTVDIVTTYGGPAMFCQIENLDGSDAITVKLNGSSSAVMTLAHGDTQIFNSGDLAITELAFANTTSGNGDVAVQVILSVRSVCNS
jgi:hypothetical protein